MSTLLQDVVKQGLETRASDWNFTAGEPVALTIDGRTVKIVDKGPLDNAAIIALLNQLIPDSSKGEVEWKDKLRVPVDLSLKFSMPGQKPDSVRFRLHAKRCFAGIGFNLRLLSEVPPDMNKLETPEAFRRMLNRHSGMIFVTGPVGSGKTTTLAAAVSHINRTRATKITTWEAPIEILHRSDQSIVEQHEVGSHADISSFEAACEAAMRENSKVIMFGELRSLAALRLAVELSDTGHLVLGTLHTGNCVQCVSRLVDAAPDGERAFFLNKISSNLLCTLSQRLIPLPSNKPGRRANYELMVVNESIASQIARGDFAQLPGSIETGKKDGMFFFDDHLADLLRTGVYTADEIFSFVPNPGATLTHFTKRGVLKPDQISKLRNKYAPSVIP